MALSLAAAGGLAWLPASRGLAVPGAGFFLTVLLCVALAGYSLRRVAALQGPRWASPLCAALFGAWLLLAWQVGVTAFEVPRVLLPAPAAIAQSLLDHAPTLWRDFVQTVLKAVLVGWVMGSGLGFGVAVAIEWPGTGGKASHVGTVRPRTRAGPCM